MIAPARVGRSITRVLWLGSFLISALWLPALARAHDQLERSLAAHMKARGAGAVHELARGFLFEGQALVRPLSFGQAGCRAVLAWGGKGLRDVDLGLYSKDGAALAEDRGATPYAYARLCADKGTQVFVSAQGYAGRGEIVLFEVEQAPRAFGRPPTDLPLAVAAGGQASAPRPVGSDEASDAFEAPLLHDERELSAAGYVAEGPPSLLELRAGVASTTVFLRAGACMRLVAFVPHARGLVMTLEDALIKREARSADAELLRLSFCSSRTGPFVLSVRTRALRALALVRAFQHPLALASDAQRFGDERALYLAEARTLAREHGQTLAHLGEAWLESERPLGWPVSLAAEQCHLFVALPERGQSTELWLTDARGNVLAHNEGRHGVPVLFACAKREERARLFVRSGGAASAVSLWQGSGGVP